MKLNYTLTIRTKSGRLHSLEYNINKNDLMNSRYDEDPIMHILSQPYICVKEKEGMKKIIPRDAIDEITLKSEDI